MAKICIDKWGPLYQSVVAPLESGRDKHSPSLAAFRKYAHALGYRIDLRLIKEKGNSEASGQ